MIQKIIQTDHSKTTIIVRLIVGAVFLSESIQKLLFPALQVAGRFGTNQSGLLGNAPRKPYRLGDDFRKHIFID